MLPHSAWIGMTHGVKHSHEKETEKNRCVSQTFIGDRRLSAPVKGGFKPSLRAMCKFNNDFSHFFLSGIF